MSQKRILTCAVTGGIHCPAMSEYLPSNPQEIAQHAIDAANAGASVVHIHARSPKDCSPSSKLEDFQTILDKIRTKNKDVVICITTGGGLGMTVEQRTHIIPHLKPELASMNCGSINWGLFPLAAKITEWKHDWEKDYYERTRAGIFQNTFADMEGILKIFGEHNVVPELECYDVGHLYNLKFMIDSGWLKGRPYMQFVLGINGALGATPYDLVTMKQTADRLFGDGNFEWSAFGAGRAEYPVCTQSLFLGGHVRVGMEDNLYLSKGVKAKTNAEMVEKMVRIMKEFDYEPMSYEESRKTLGINKKV
ncbi:MAG: 3-keto-5-aminohexanoate cleavage protein [Spirochaetes bacterium]|nr:3-keto-5-aminohexanoate cleavage protein [Spirochaetota bacterium]